MKQSTFTKNEIQEYIFPELKNLRALFKGLHLVNTLTALQFLENILEVELNHRDKKTLQ